MSAALLIGWERSLRRSASTLSAMRRSSSFSATDSFSSSRPWETK